MKQMRGEEGNRDESKISGLGEDAFSEIGNKICVRGKMQIQF